MHKQTDIFLLGTGIHSTVQLTLETIQALKICKQVYVLHDDLDVLRRLSEYNSSINDVAYLFEKGGKRCDAYKAISHLVVDSARQEAPVAFVVHGHPLFLVSATEYTLELAQANDLIATVLPGISCLNTIMCDLQIDLGYALQIYDATLLVDGKYAINPSIPLLVFQLTSLLTDHVIADSPDYSTLEPLVKHLLNFYPEQHEAVIVNSSSHTLDRAERSSVTIGTLGMNEKIPLWKRPSLYVPTSC